jgi:hypothetical protein
LGYILGHFSKTHLVTLVTTAALKKMTTPRMAYLVRFENKNIFLYFKKNALSYISGVVFMYLGLAPDDWEAQPGEAENAETLFSSAN